jgi:hypothetical protein
MATYIKGADFKENAPTKVSLKKETPEEPKQQVIPELPKESVAAKVIESVKIKERKVDEERQNHIYVLSKKNGKTFFLRSAGFTIYDEENKSRREVRYCSNEQSIFVDEQGSFVMREPVKFSDGMITVTYDNPALIEFLERHPDNEKNGGTTFRKLVKEKTSEKELDTAFLEADVIALIKNSSVTDLYPMAMHYGVTTEQSAKDTKADLLRIGRSRPQEFLSIYNSPTTKLKAMVKTAHEYNIITLKPEAIYWFDSQAVIIQNPQGKRPEETMAAFLTSDNGLAVLEEIQKQLNGIK